MEVYTLQIPPDPLTRARAIIEDERAQLQTSFRVVKRRASRELIKFALIYFGGIIGYVYISEYTWLAAVAMISVLMLFLESLSHKGQGKIGELWALYREMKEMKRRIEQLDSALVVAINKYPARS